MTPTNISLCEIYLFEVVVEFMFTPNVKTCCTERLNLTKS